MLKVQTLLTSRVNQVNFNFRSRYVYTLYVMHANKFNLSPARVHKLNTTYTTTHAIKIKFYFG